MTPEEELADLQKKYALLGECLASRTLDASHAPRATRSPPLPSHAFDRRLFVTLSAPPPRVDRQRATARRTSRRRNGR